MSPTNHQHFLTLKDGRTLSYFTFEEEEKNNKDKEADTASESSKSNKRKHPVIFFHGFPGSGREGFFAHKPYCQVYGIDRPGKYIQ